MYKDFQLSLYDFFGYFLPGLVLVSSYFVWTWPLEKSFVDHIKLDAQTWVFLVVVSYLSGHALQGFANFMLRKRYEKEKFYREGSGGVPPVIEERIKEKIQGNFGNTLKDMDEKWVYLICDRATLGDGAGLLEMYVYREGFYRGMFFAVLALGISCFGRWAGEMPSSAILPDREEIMLKYILVAAIVLCVSSLFFFQRYGRFREYRIHHALLGFLVQKEKKEPEEKPALSKSTLPHQYANLGKSKIFIRRWILR